MDRTELEGLKEFATPRQREYIDAIIARGSIRKAAESMGLNHPVISRAMQAVKMRAAQRGYAPAHDMVHTTPYGYNVKGVSTLYTHGEDGQKVAAQWVKTELNKSQRQELLEEWVQGLKDEVPARKPVPTPKPSSKDVLSCYVMGDPHAGLYAWNEEAGEDYNLNKWAEEHRKAMVELVDSAPASDEALIVNLGDFFHADDHKSQTPGSGHALDVDTRHAKVFREGCATFEFMIDTALRKHRRVVVYVTKGNHDPESSFALAEVLRAYYRNEKRVEIRGGIAYREYHVFGCNLIGITHGDKAKPKDLPAVMAAEKAVEWGQSTCRRWLVGHFHHQDRQEYPGCIVEVFPTLARNDAWHSGMGYISEKAMNCIVFDRKYGEHGRRIVTPRHINAG